MYKKARAFADKQRAMITFGSLTTGDIEERVYQRDIPLTVERHSLQNADTVRSMTAVLGFEFKSGGEVTSVDNAGCLYGKGLRPGMSLFSIEYTTGARSGSHMDMRKLFFNDGCQGAKLAARLDVLREAASRDPEVEPEKVRLDCRFRVADTDATATWITGSDSRGLTKVAVSCLSDVAVCSLVKFGRSDLVVQASTRSRRPSLSCPHPPSRSLSPSQTVTLTLTLTRSLRPHADANPPCRIPICGNVCLASGPERSALRARAAESTCSKRCLKPRLARARRGRPCASSSSGRTRPEQLCVREGMGRAVCGHR